MGTYNTLFLYDSENYHFQTLYYHCEKTTYHQCCWELISDRSIPKAYIFVAITIIFVPPYILVCKTCK